MANANAPRQINLSDNTEMDQAQMPNPFSPAAPTASTSTQEAPVGSKDNPHKDQSNAPANRERDFEVHSAAAKKFGNEDGKGKKAFVSWARDLVDGGAEGTLTVSKLSQDASKLYKEFMDASMSASAKVLSEDNKLSEQVQISKVKAFIKLGSRYPTDALNLFDKARKMHADMVSAKKDVRYKSTYTALVKVATEQCAKVPHPTDPNKKVDRAVLTDAELSEILVAPETEAKVTTGADLLIAAMNMIQHAINGREATENREGRDAVKHPDLPVIHQALHKAIGEIDPAALKADEDDKAAIAAKKAAAAKRKADAEVAKKKAAEDAAAKAAQKPAGDDDADENDDENNDEIPQDLVDEMDAE